MKLNEQTHLKGELKLYECNGSAIRERWFAVRNLLKSGKEVEKWWQAQALGLVISQNNTIIKAGRELFLGSDGGQSLVVKIVGGEHSSPTPSTFTTQSELQQPITQLHFPKIGYSMTVLANGFKHTYHFWRSMGSASGRTMTEAGLMVARADGTNALMSRVVQNQTGVTSLPYTFPSDRDTKGTWEITETYL